MSSIQPIKLNYQQQQNLNKSKANSAYKQSFGKKTVLTDLEKKICSAAIKELKDNLNPFSKGFINVSKFLNEHSGEIQNQAINAAFTTTLAPVMIAFNPFSKSDDKTKKYSALRQPISAGIAISGGLAMTMLINYYMNQMINSGYISSIDGRINPDKSYLKSYFNKDFAEAKDKKVFLSEYEPDMFEGKKFNKNGNPTRKYKKACLEKYAETIQEQRKKLFTALIGENPDNIKINEKGVISVTRINSKGKKVVEELGKNIPNLNDNKQLQDYLKKNNLHNRNFSDTMQELFNFEFYKDGEVKPSTVKNKLKEIKAMDFLKKVGIIGENTQIKDLKTVDGKDLGKLFRINEDVSKLNLEEFLEKLKQIEAKDKIKTAQEILIKKTQKLEKLLNKKTSEVLGFFERLIKKRKIPNFKRKAGVLDFAGNIIADNIKKVGKHAPAIKSFTGIGFNLVTTMITCTILNWAYPRIVERLFPDLVKSDKKPEIQKGGHK